MPSKQITYAEAVRSALDYCLDNDPDVVLIGEGVPDPKGIFGTTAGLQEKYGEDRVLDMPLSENAMTGICIGAAINGLRPVLVHQRVDFALLSMDQIINNAAKWRYMFNGKMSVPMVIRMIVGRGWGQGPQHSQSLQSLFAHIPGLKVYMPTFADDARNMMIDAIEDDDPVIFIEHRWLHPIQETITKPVGNNSTSGAKLVRTGDRITIAAFSYMVIEALHAARVLSEYGIEVEILDMRYVRPLDVESVIKSTEKTGNLIVAEAAVSMCGVSAEVVAAVCESSIHLLKKPPIRITMPDHPVPTTHFLSSDCYTGAFDIIDAVVKLLDVNISMDEIAKSHLQQEFLRDVPYHDFIGPF